MGFLKELTREVRDKSWLPKASDLLEKLGPSSRQPVVEKSTPDVKQRFCDANSLKPCVTVCTPSVQCDCACVTVREALAKTLDRLGVQITVGDLKAGCAGRCRSGPLLGFPQKGFFYLGVQPQDVPDIVYETIIHGRHIFRLLSINPDRVYRPDLYYERETGFLATIDNSICMVEVTKYFLDLEKGVSCGKCVPCRLGLQRMYESIDRIVAGQGSLDDLDQLRSLCQSMISLPHCEFAMTSTRPALSALTYFEDEFLAHIEGHQCPAGVCKELVAMQRKEERRRKPKR